MKTATMKPLPRCHEAAARAFASVLAQAGCRALTAAAVERGLRWWWGFECGEKPRTVRAISKRVVEIMEEMKMRRRQTNKVPHAECCARCGEQSILHNHHKTAVQDGGSDNTENIITLCITCHAEWHMIEQSKASRLYPFEIWLRLPSYLELLVLFTNQDTGINLEDAKQAFIKAVDITRSFRRIEVNNG